LQGGIRLSEYEFTSGNVYRIAKKHMTQLFEIFQVKNIDELRKKLEAGFNPELESIKERKEKAQADYWESHAVIEKYKADFIKQGKTEKQIKSDLDKIQTVSPIDEKNSRLQCTICGILFMYKTHSEKIHAKESYIDHKYKRHGLGLTELERQEITAL